MLLLLVLLLRLPVTCGDIYVVIGCRLPILVLTGELEIRELCCVDLARCSSL